MPEESIPLVDVIQLSSVQCQKPILGDLKYASDDNFVGRIIDGYHNDARDICLLAPQAAAMVCQAQNYLYQHYNLSLIILDAYRPLRAVRDFVHWFQQPPTHEEVVRKKIHYPDLEKNQLGKEGYIAETVSRHCYGQAVDVVLIDPNNHRELDMGTCFDYFGELSHSTRTEDELGIAVFQNRKILSDVMAKFHFQVHPKEYWHFDFHVREIQEPLDIIITPDLKGLGVELIPEIIS